MGGLGMLFGFLLFAGFLILVALVVVWLIRQTRGGAVAPKLPAAPESARELLDARYARGEISREEYLQTVDDLGAKRA